MLVVASVPRRNLSGVDLPRLEALPSEEQIIVDLEAVFNLKVWDLPRRETLLLV